MKLQSSNVTRFDIQPQGLIVAGKPAERSELMWVLVLYVLASFAVTYPLGLKMFTERPVGGDSWQNVWNLWWTRQALLSPELSLLYCPLIFYPEGLSLALHSNSYFNSVLSLPLQGVFSLESIHYFLLWVYFPASALAAYCLARRFITAPFAAFIAGWVYAFCPYRVGRYVIEQVDVLSTAFLPLFILFALRFLARPNWKDSLRGALFLGLQVLSSWYNGAFCVLFLAFMLVYYWLEGSLPVGDALMRGRFWKGLVAMVALPAVALSPLWVPMLRDLATPMFAPQADSLTICQETSSDLLAFVTPGVLYPTFLTRSMGRHGPIPGSLQQWIAERILAGRGSNVLEATSYIGWVNLFLLLVCFFWFRKMSQGEPNRNSLRFWLFAVGAFALLSLGPVLHIAGWNTGVPLPYFLINALPGFSMLRAPVRLGILLMLAVGICVAYVFERWQQRGKRKLALVVALLVVLDLALFPLQRLWSSKPIPQVYSLMASDPVPGAVLEIPSGYHFDSSWYNVRAMYYQTRHHRPLLVGYISRTPVDPYGMLDRYPILRTVSHEALRQRKAPSGVDVRKARHDLESLNVRYIVLHKGDVREVVGPSEGGTMGEELHELLQSIAGTPVGEDNESCLFQLKAEGVVPSRR